MFYVSIVFVITQKTLISLLPPNQRMSHTTYVSYHECEVRRLFNQSFVFFPSTKLRNVYDLGEQKNGCGKTLREHE